MNHNLAGDLGESCPSLYIGKKKANCFVDFLLSYFYSATPFLIVIVFGRLIAMKNSIWAVLLCVGLALSLDGCLWGRQKINVENFHDKATQVKPGKTTAKQLPGIFGTPPNAVITKKNGKEIHVYSFGDSKTKGFVAIIVNFTKENKGLDTAHFYIDANGVVEEKIISTNSQDVAFEWWPFGDD